MVRKFLLVLLPFAVPFLLYGLYYLGLRLRRKSGASDVPWTILFVSGLTLTIITLFVYGITSVSEPGLDYVPARVIDGEVVPAETK